MCSTLYPKEKSQDVTKTVLKYRRTSSEQEVNSRPLSGMFLIFRAAPFFFHVLKYVSRETNEVLLCCLGEEWTRRGCLAVDWHEENFSSVNQAILKVRYSVTSPHVFHSRGTYNCYFCTHTHTLHR